MICSICSTEFDLEAEGGISGDIGILPVSLCPYCWNGLQDAFDIVRGCIHGEECVQCEEDYIRHGDQARL